MKLIKPAEISARILTLLEESDERVVIVSPYMKISKWYKLTHKLNELKTRRVRLEIYVRDDPDNTATYNDMDQQGLQYKKIPNLHSKLYMNERCGIVTSMNLLLSSEIYSLEIGYTTENWKEYNELLDYYERYIYFSEAEHSVKITRRPATELNEFMQCFKDELSIKEMIAWPWLAKNVLHISTGKNNYIVSINNSYLRITSSLGTCTGTIQRSNLHSSLIAQKIAELSAMKIKLRTDPVADNIQFSGQAQSKLKSTSVSEILKAEIPYVVESVIRFIDASEDLELNL